MWPIAYAYIIFQFAVDSIYYYIRLKILNVFSISSSKEHNFVQKLQEANVEPSNYCVITIRLWLPDYSVNAQCIYIICFRGMCDQTPERAITVSSERPSFTLQGLSPHSHYRVSVAAKTNIAGPSVHSTFICFIRLFFSTRDLVIRCFLIISVPI